MEDDIYKMLRNEFIITNNSSLSLFSIPRNKRFVFFNMDRKIRSDPIIDSIIMLHECMERSAIKKLGDEYDDLDEFRPFKGFAKPWNADKKTTTRFDDKNERNVLNLIKDHVNEALQYGFDDSMSKYRGKSHFVVIISSIDYINLKYVRNIFI